MGDALTNGQRRVLRVYVEPVEVELDEDGALLFSSLQSALPGASGLYFKDEFKSSVRFDGKRLVPPADGWKDRKYFAGLGCRSDFPFGSYSNASKQFERSVNAVQRMFGKTGPFELGVMGTELATKKSTKPKTTNGAGDTQTEGMKQLLTSLTQKQISSSASSGSEDQKASTPLEQQFVDLARISTAKDTIIEQQRSDIKTVNDKLEGKIKELDGALEELTKIEKRCNAQEEELNILRGLSREQTYMCEKVNELTKRILDADEVATSQKARIADLEQRLATSEAHNGRSSTQINELSKEVENGNRTIEDLRDRLGKLSPLASTRQITDDGKVLTYVQMSDSVASLRIRNEKLEEDMKGMEQKYNQLNRIYGEVVAEATQNSSERSVHGEDSSSATSNIPPDGGETAGRERCWQEEMEVMKSQLNASESKVAELTRMVQALTVDATRSEQRASDALLRRNELRRSMDQMNGRIQVISDARILILDA